MSLVMDKAPPLSASTDLISLASLLRPSRVRVLALAVALTKFVMMRAPLPLDSKVELAVRLIWRLVVSPAPA